MQISCIETIRGALQHVEVWNLLNEIRHFYKIIPYKPIYMTITQWVDHLHAVTPSHYPTSM